MRLSGADIYGRGATATFAEGANGYDWDIVGGTLVITDAHGARAQSFMIQLGDADGGFQGWSAARFAPARVLRGVPFGTYTMSVRRGSAPREPISTVTLSADAPRAEAVVDVP